MSIEMRSRICYLESQNKELYERIEVLEKKNDEMMQLLASKQNVTKKAGKNNG
jgi:hypothetical protein